jgi:hypothetical protein
MGDLDLLPAIVSIFIWLFSYYYIMMWICMYIYIYVGVYSCIYISLYIIINIHRYIIIVICIYVHHTKNRILPQFWLQPRPYPHPDLAGPGVIWWAWGSFKTLAYPKWTIAAAPTFYGTRRDIRPVELWKIPWTLVKGNDPTWLIDDLLGMIMNEMG